ncbi:MAG: glycosyltransferase family 4 protein [Acidimicrobiia bacterium]
MRIAVIGPLDLPGTQGGMTRHTEEIYSRLAARGHEITCFVANDNGLSSFRGMKLVRVRALRFPGWRRLGYSLLASFGASSFRRSFDVVHYHSFSSTGFCFLPRARNRKVLVTVHRLEWQDEKWNRFERSFLRWSEWIAVRCAQALIAVSQNFVDDLRRRYPRMGPISYVPNGVAPPAPGDPAALRSRGLEPDRYLLFVGRLVPEKGLDVLLDAVEILRARGVEIGAVAIVGGGHAGSGYLADLEQRAATTNGVVRLLGTRTGAELASLFSYATAFVIPSFHEGQPLTVLEAMSYGRAIIASDIPAHTELLADEAVFFRAGDAGDLATAIARVLDDPDLRHHLGDAGQRRIKDGGEFDWDRVADATEHILERITGGASAERA